ncbi:MAG: ATP-binding protein [Lentisphaerae bacterium]|nr:ATP-binding protein [Lentisphaerota bacterium]
MIERPYWMARMAALWEKAPIVWLSGVRRSGKTTLARSLREALYLNCDLPSVQTLLGDPEAFYRDAAGRIVVLDEVHQLRDPSRLLKIGADHRPRVRILATGSSTLEATRKFRDSLTGRKRMLTLMPVLAEELDRFGCADLRVRLLRGGLPEPLLGRERDPGYYAEWMDSYFARDVAELFNIDKRAGFLHLAEALFRQSGGLMEVASLSRDIGISRPTVMTYLDAMQITHLIHVLRPFHGSGGQELVRRPKVYAFDTGFAAFARGWSDLRPEDCGALFEHLVLETLLTLEVHPRLYYWRDKQGREVDFVAPRGDGAQDAIEVKWNADAWEPRNLAEFRRLHPKGRNLVVSPQSQPAYRRHRAGLEVWFARVEDLRGMFGNPRGEAPQESIPGRTGVGRASSRSPGGDLIG